MPLGRNPQRPTHRSGVQQDIFNLHKLESDYICAPSNFSDLEAVQNGRVQRW